MTDETYFKNRKEAGKQLAATLTNYKDSDAIVLALPRGGVAVAYEVSQVLHKPLDVFISRKIGAPGNPEFGIGAIAEGDVLILNNEIIEQYGISQDEVDRNAAQELDELQRRIGLYRNGQSLSNVKGKTVILVDDGLATGVTAHAALASLENMLPDKLVFAAPVCSYYSAGMLSELADEITCILKPFDLIAIGSYYKEFEQVTDEQVVKLLRKAGVYG